MANSRLKTANLSKSQKSVKQSSNPRECALSGPGLVLGGQTTAPGPAPPSHRSAPAGGRPSVLSLRHPPSRTAHGEAGVQEAHLKVPGNTAAAVAGTPQGSLSRVSHLSPHALPLVAAVRREKRLPDAPGPLCFKRNAAPAVTAKWTKPHG